MHCTQAVAAGQDVRMWRGPEGGRRSRSGKVLLEAWSVRMGARRGGADIAIADEDQGVGGVRGGD